MRSSGCMRHEEVHSPVEDSTRGETTERNVDARWLLIGCVCVLMGIKGQQLQVEAEEHLLGCGL